MFTCTLCRFEVVLDDVKLRSEVKGTVICIGCYAHATDTEKRLSKKLINEISALLAGVTA